MMAHPLWMFDTVHYVFRNRYGGDQALCNFR